MKTAYLIALPLLAVTLQLTGCKKDEVTTPDPTAPHYGTTQTLGKGTARTFVKLDGNENPDEVGIVVSESALNSLPSDMAELVLDLPAEGSKTPFKHAYVTYMPHGHEPDGIYNLPHFDFHFYKITNAERLTMTPDKMDEIGKAPDAAYLPANYVSAGPVPMMGAHWVDATSPELNGQTFTKTFLYGSNKGDVIFYEPMITVDYLKKATHEHIAIKQPQKIAPAGYYPSAYAIRYNATDKQYEIVLEKMVNQ
ncbi:MULTISPECIES: DUF5602 domain-containing protein [unclassified Spirosoma]|uniref:DUF5602 domain-containing protein n=1 Tax=unclassified Spirosoma TaxID=2621999 RepID=UPI0009682A80|nr:MULTISPECIES: DUF5602 domain-containing protein [unclassified Spirosoma]MBN8822328.1 DUF5602 domain-containing protein [Spirosoma sp.]OJW72373.1 MAG: hypothetical protein BGO59_14620 [Spirosoma sp. 48-14]